MGDVHAERVLELNDGHEVFNKLKSAFETDKSRAALLAELLYGQAVLMAGLPLDDAVRYAEITNELVGA
jgi:molecular chaperone HtpG